VFAAVLLGALAAGGGAAEAGPSKAYRLRVDAVAYHLPGKTALGIRVRKGVVAVDPTPARIVQFSLITRPLPSPAQISTLMARLQALMGETRCGSPAFVDSWAPGAFEMTPFAPVDANVLHPDDLRVSAPPRPV